VLLATPPARISCRIAPFNRIVPLATPPLKTYWIAPAASAVAPAEP
jgi:hypothetical protein